MRKVLCFYCTDAFLIFSSRSFAFSQVLQTRRRLYLRSNPLDSPTGNGYTVSHGGDHTHRNRDIDNACTESGCTTYSDWASVPVCSVFGLCTEVSGDSPDRRFCLADSPSMYHEYLQSHKEVISDTHRCEHRGCMNTTKQKETGTQIHILKHKYMNCVSPLLSTKTERRV